MFIKNLNKLEKKKMKAGVYTQNNCPEKIEIGNRVKSTLQNCLLRDLCFDLLRPND